MRVFCSLSRFKICTAVCIINESKTLIGKSCFSESFASFISMLVKDDWLQDLSRNGENFMIISKLSSVGTRIISFYRNQHS